MPATGVSVAQWCRWQIGRVGAVVPVKQARVLHVDDDPDIRNIVSLSLGTIGGFEVKSCASASEALDVVGSFQPHLALLDLMMPEIDGEQLFGMLRQREDTRDLPVVFVTAQALDDTRNRLCALGAISVIFKPFDPLTLPMQIQQILDQESPEPV